MTEFHKIILGQSLLCICCVFYLIWWGLSFRPDVTVNREGGINGLLLLITAISGLAGVALSLIGVNSLQAVDKPKVNGAFVLVCGIAVYVFLLILTRLAFKRPVTTELLLITAWAMLEMTVISSLNAGGRLTDIRFWILAAVVAIAFVGSMILYVLYYRMEPMRAFYAAMVPLITEGASMLVVILLSI